MHITQRNLGTFVHIVIEMVDDHLGELLASASWR